MSRLLFLVLALGLGACASQPSENNDPFEKTNRVVFDANNKLDDYVALPLAKAYVAVVPEPGRQGIHNAIQNLDTPVTFGNDVLQGDFNHAVQSLYRFTVNSTLGLGGLIDVADKLGHVPAHDADFGETLGKWGVGEGPYLVLPLLGPSNPRDAIGSAADYFMDPVLYMRFHGRATEQVTKGVVGLIDLRARNIDTIEQVKSTAVDYYATTRSLYRQNRNSQIHNGTAPEDLPDL